MKTFEVKYLKEVRDFLRNIDEKARKKLTYNINNAKTNNNTSIFKKLTNTDIWEFRARVKGMHYRLFAFWDMDKKALVICTHGIVKKQQKTPIKEIKKAEQIRKEYLNNNWSKNLNLEI